MQSAELYLNQTMQKKFVVIILARGGSKGIKNKNLTKVNGKPLIYWTLKSCLNSKKIKSFWVSSDSKKILKYAKENRSNIIQRPKNLSTNTSTSMKTHFSNGKNLTSIYFDLILPMSDFSCIFGVFDFTSFLGRSEGLFAGGSGVRQAPPGVF